MGLPLVRRYRTLPYLRFSLPVHTSLRLSEHPPPSPPPLAPSFSANSTNNTLELTQSSGLIGPVFVGGAAGEHVEGRGHSRGRWRGGRQRSGRGGEKGNRGGSRGGEGDDGRHRRVQGQAGEECTREELSFVFVVLHLVRSVGRHRFLFSLSTCWVACTFFLFLHVMETVFIAHKPGNGGSATSGCAAAAAAIAVAEIISVFWLAKVP